MLKTLSQAIQDGDSIECIVRETGVNQDGRTPGITMPSPRAQETLIRQTYEKAGLNPEVDGCQYFEAHGGWSLNLNLFFFFLLLSCALSPPPFPFLFPLLRLVRCKHQRP